MSMTQRLKHNLPSPLLALTAYCLTTLAVILSLKYLTLIAAPIFFAFVLAYMFNPLVNLLEKRTPLSRGPITAILMIALVLVLIFVLINLFPYMADEVNHAAEKFPDTLEKFSSKLKGIDKYFSDHFPDYAVHINLKDKLKELIGNVLVNLSNILGTAFSSLYGIMVAMIYLVFIPWFAYYFIKDYRKIQNFLFDMVPTRYRKRVNKRIEELNTILSSFIRGQAIVVLILTVLYSLGLSLIGLPFAILIGIVAGVGDIIPYFGTVVGFLLSLVVGITHFQSFEGVLLIIMVFAVVKGSENWFFYPKIVGKEVGLHFLWVLMAIIIFGKLFGFWGLFVAIPVTAGFKMYLKDLMDYYKKSPFFNKEEI